MMNVAYLQFIREYQLCLDTWRSINVNSVNQIDKLVTTRLSKADLMYGMLDKLTTLIDKLRISENRKDYSVISKEGSPNFISHIFWKRFRTDFIKKKIHKR